MTKERFEQLDEEIGNYYPEREIFEALRAERERVKELEGELREVMNDRQVTLAPDLVNRIFQTLSRKEAP